MHYGLHTSGLLSVTFDILNPGKIGGRQRRENKALNTCCILYCTNLGTEMLAKCLNEKGVKDQILLVNLQKRSRTTCTEWVWQENIMWRMFIWDARWRYTLNRLALMLKAHNWQKWKSTLLTCHCHEIYREEAVGLKSSNYTKKYDFCEYVKFEAISLKNDILTITAFN